MNKEPHMKQLEAFLDDIHGLYDKSCKVLIFAKGVALDTPLDEETEDYIQENSLL